MLKHRVLPLLLLGLFSLSATASPEERQESVRQFVAEMVSKHGFDQQSLLELMNQARFRHDIIKTMTRPAEAKPWYQYRPIFVTRARAEQGVAFWKANEVLLGKAEQEFGVPAEIIVAIIGVETRYGNHTGGYRVIDALSTLAFGYPKRAEFFRRELEQFLLLSREESVDLAEAKGSYAGAVGVPQFIPSSYRAYAVDFDGDGRRDLWNSTADAIGSVASYFKRHGWQPGGPVTVRAQTGSEVLDELVDAGMKPSLSLERLSRHGVAPERPVPDDALASLIRLENESDAEYWLGLHNFYVITRYNHSNLYAMAVYQLSQDIRELHEATRDGLVSR